MKKTTTDLRRETKKNLIILPNPNILKKRKSGFSSRALHEKRFDLVAPQKKRQLFCLRNAALITAFFLILSGGMAAKNTIAKKQEIQDLTQKAQQEFMVAVDYFSAHKFNTASEAFRELESTITQMRSTLSPILYASRSQEDASLDQVFILAEELARAGQRISAVGPELSRLPSFLLSGNTPEIQNLLTLLEKEQEGVRRFLNLADAALQDIKQNPLTPDEFRQYISGFDSQLKSAQNSLKVLSDLFPAAYELLGENGPQTVVILFQNSGEIRATGGFPGSLLVLRFENDRIVPEFFDIYALSWKLPLDDPPPPGFDRLTKKLTLQDANYSANFPTSAERIRNMLQETGIPGPITIIAITDEILSDFLQISGPIPIPGYDVSLTSENASTLLSFFVEGKAFGKKTPKEVIKELFPDFIAAAKEIPPKDLLGLFEKGIEQKKILAHSHSLSLQQLFFSLGITGEIKNPQTKDYLAVFSANVGGNKSDHFLSEELFLSSVIDTNGQVNNALRVIRTHNWGKKENAFIDGLLEKYGNFLVHPELLRTILGAGENHSYTSIFVPLGSKLLDIKGIPIQTVNTENRFGKTVFSFRFPKVSAGKEELVEIFYRLPGSISKSDTFDLYYQSQPGRGTVRVSREVIPESGVSEAGSFYASEELLHDALFSAQIR